MDNSNRDYNDLKEFLYRVKGDIPLVEFKEQTFLNILNKEHHENSWSDLYAFFFNPEGSHRLGKLLVTSLLEMIPQEKNSITFGDRIIVKREDSTKDRKRLDLALCSDNSVILIENKVFHILNNDLQKYWINYKQRSKIGIILSLYPISIKLEDKVNWINITHKMFMDKVMENFKNFDVNEPNKYAVLLKDFYINICNVTNEMDKNKIDFCFDNISMVERIVQLRNQVRNAVKESIKSGAEQFNLKPDERESASCIYYKTNDKKLMYTILYDKLFTESQSIKIIIELNGDLIAKYKGHENEIPFTSDERNLINLTKYFDKERNNWVHIAVTKRYILSNDDILNIPNFIENKIKEETCFCSIFNKIRTFKNNI